MYRRPPRVTLTDTHFPSQTRFRSPRFARASEAAKQAKRIPSRRPYQVVFEKTRGRSEHGRLRQIWQQAQRLVPKGFLEQSASQALAKTRFPPRMPTENVQRGLAAADLVVEQEIGRAHV